MRIRTIKPEFWKNEALAKLPEFTRLLAIALLNYCDDEGYFAANVALIRGELFPFSEDSVRIHGSLSELSKQGYLKLSQGDDGRTYGWIVNFVKHQRINRANESKIKTLADFTERAVRTHTQLSERSHPELEREVEQGMGNGTCIEEVAPVPVARKERNLVLDALATVGGGDPLQVTPKAWPRHATALSQIKAVCSDLTVEEVRRRGENYRLHFSSTLTSTGLANNWAQCDKPPPPQRNNHFQRQTTNSMVDDRPDF